MTALYCGARWAVRLNGTYRSLTLYIDSALSIILNDERINVIGNLVACYLPTIDTGLPLNRGSLSSCRACSRRASVWPRHVAAWFKAAVGNSGFSTSLVFRIPSVESLAQGRAGRSAALRAGIGSGKRSGERASRRSDEHAWSRGRAEAKPFGASDRGAPKSSYNASANTAKYASDCSRARQPAAGYVGVRIAADGESCVDGKSRARRPRAA